MSTFRSQGQRQELVRSTRIRLARNIKGMAYALSGQKKEQMIDRVWGALQQNPVLSRTLSVHRARDLTPVQRQDLIENHVISKELPEDGAYVISEDGGLCVLLGEEDHIRLQVMGDGDCPRECLQTAQRVLRVIEQVCPFDYDDKLGYLTACPTNVGTGLRASVMLHLPMLTAARQIEAVQNDVGRAGFVLRGAYGEGSRAEAQMYQLSNQVTLGQSEEEIVASLSRLTDAVLERECAVREQVFDQPDGQWVDTVARSLGILQRARRLTGQESERYLSHLLLGIERKVIEGVTPGEIYRLLPAIQPAALQMQKNQNLSPDERDRARAALVRPCAAHWRFIE